MVLNLQLLLLSHDVNFAPESPLCEHGRQTCSFAGFLFVHDKRQLLQLSLDLFHFIKLQLTSDSQLLIPCPINFLKINFPSHFQDRHDYLALAIKHDVKAMALVKVVKDKFALVSILVSQVLGDLSELLPRGDFFIGEELDILYDIDDGLDILGGPLLPF